MDHGAPPPLQQLPSAVVWRRRRNPRSPRQQATIPIVPPPAPAALPVPPSGPRQIPAPPAAAGAADAHNLMLLAHTAVSQADTEAEAASRPALAPAGGSPPLSPAAADEEEEKPYDAPPLPPLAVGHQNPSSFSMGHVHAATKGTAGDCKKAACPQPQGNAGSSKGDHSGGGVVSPAAGASPMQLGDEEEEELEPGEIPPEKPAAGCNADSAHESLLGKDEEMAAGEEEAKTIAGEPAVTGSSSAHCAAPAVVVSMAVVVGRDGKAATEMSAAQEKRMREVFVGGLSRDAMEEDVRAALSAAGEITQVRTFMDRTTGKNKGYCFVAYRDAAMASKAVAEFGNVKICGKQCRVAVPEGNEKTNKIAQRDPTIEDYNSIYEQRQAVHSSYITSWDHHAASYVVPPVGVAIQAGYYYPMYHNGNIVYLPPPDLNHGLTRPSGRSQMGQSGSGRSAGQPHRSRN